MKKYSFLALVFALLLTACVTPTSEPTPTPAPTPVFTWWVNTPEPTPPPEPTPEPTPFLSYEDYFAQTIDYGSIFEDTEGVDSYYGHVEWLSEADPDVLSLVQERIPDDTLGLIPKTMRSVADRCLYVFWAGNEEGAYLYRLYGPTETLDLIYTIPKEEFEEKYFYTPQTEATVSVLWDLDCQVGERVCLLTGVGARTNQLYEWGTENPEFLALFDKMFAHQEDYPQYNWGQPYEDLIWRAESEHDEERLYLHIYRCINAATGEYREKTSNIYGPDQYEVQW